MSKMLLQPSLTATLAPAGSAGGAHQNTVTSGDITLNSTAWADVPGPVTVTVDATAGQILQIGLVALFGSEAVSALLDAATVVSGSVVNYVGAGEVSGSGGVRAWTGLSGTSNGVGGSVLYTVQAGDVVDGTVTLRLRYRTASAAAKTLRAGVSNQLKFYAANLG